MDLSLWFNNATSITLVITCWWLSHQYARVKPPGRVISAMLALLGFATLFTMLARNLDVSVAVIWTIIFQKAILSLCLLLISIRRTRKDRDAKP